MTTKVDHTLLDQRVSESPCVTDPLPASVPVEHDTAMGEESKANMSGGDELGPAGGASQPWDRPPDPFNPDSLRLPQNFAATIGVQKVLATVPVKKPGKESWVRVHSESSYCIETAVIELKEDREIYLVSRDLWPELSAEATFGPRAFFTAITRQGVLFLWPVRLPGPDGRLDAWSQSALEATTIAQRQWIRVTANMSLGAYEIFKATGDIPEPIWPQQSFSELLRIAFRDRLINSLEHPVLKRLRGEG